MNASWAFPFIVFAGMLQAAGAAMGGELNRTLHNSWLATSMLSPGRAIGAVLTIAGVALIARF